MIVGFLGFIGSGKGTAGDILVRNGFEKESFAASLKDISSLMFGWDRALLEGDTPESRKFRETPCPFWTEKFGKEFSPRMALQLMGTEVGRNLFHENFWIMNLEKRLDKSKDYVITDVRFPNEIKFIKDNGGFLVETRRGTKPHWYDVAAQANNGIDAALRFMEKEGPHISEWAWIGTKIDAMLENNGSLEEFESKVITTVSGFLTK